MSRIDTVKHLRLGIFLGVPLYQPLETGCRLVHRNPQDGHRIPKHLISVPAGEQILVLGEGSGGHPAIIFHDVEHCVARYLKFSCRIESEGDQELERASASVQGDLQTIEYCNWTSQNHLDFRERCGFFFSCYKSELTFEGWLLASLGEFVFHTIPSFSPRIQRWHAKYVQSAIPRFEMILIPYDRYGGNGKDRFQVLDTEAQNLAKV